MSWTRSAEPQGNTVWKGSDSLFAPFHEARQVQSFAVGFLGTGIVLSLAIAMTAIPGALLVLLVVYIRAPLWIGYLLQYSLIALAAYWVFTRTADTFSFGLLPVPRFYTRCWVLIGSNGTLTLKAGKFDGLVNADEVSGRSPSGWSVPFDAVERVEVCLTKEWIPARQYHGAPARQRGYELVPSDEYQTYLHLKDGTRRVILTANADREGCASLALSVREWIEDERRDAARLLVVAGDEGYAV